MRMGIVTLLLAIGLLSLPDAARAEDCRQALTEQWPGLVEAERVEPIRTVWLPDDAPSIVPPDIDADEQAGGAAPGGDPLAGRFARLRTICADDAQALSDLVTLEARRAHDARNFERALALLAMRDPDPENPNFARNAWMWLTARAETGADIDGAYMGDATIWQIHDERMRAEPVLRKVEEFDVADFHIWSYALEGDVPVWIFVAKDGAVPALETTVAGPSRYDLPEGEQYLAYRRFGCSVEGGIDQDLRPLDETVTYESVKASLVAFYLSEEPEEPGWLVRDRKAPLDAFCPNADKLLLGLGPVREFTGGEYRDAATPPSEAELMRSLVSDQMDERVAATEWVMDHPDAVQPMNFIYVVTTLLGRGDMERAAFWYYFYQIRFRPWIEADSDPSGAPALAGSISYMLGTPINEWAGSDRDAYLALWRRAAHFEAYAPLYPGRPEDVSEKRWRRLIADARKAYDPEMMAREMPPTDEWEGLRRENGLYVGPWQEPGTPLKEEWR